MSKISCDKNKKITNNFLNVIEIFLQNVTNFFQYKSRGFTNTNYSVLQGRITGVISISSTASHEKMLRDADKVPFVGKEARYFRSVVNSEDNRQYFRYCKTMGDFLRKVDEIKNMRNMGLGLATDKMDWLLYASSDELYPHSEYVPWRMQEEQTMRLLCLGRGNVMSKGSLVDLLCPKVEAYFGVFCADLQLGKRLQAKWGHSMKSSIAALSTDEIFNDIIETRAETELTVFVYLNQELKLADVQKRFAPLFVSSDYKINNEEKKTIKLFIHWLGVLRFSKKEKFLTKDLNLKKGTKVIFSISDLGSLLGEVMCSGPWSCSMCYTLGYVKQPKVAETLMHITLGKKPLSEECKQEVGKSALYLARGGDLPRSQFETSIPFRHMNDWQRPGTPPYPYPTELELKPSTAIFHLPHPSSSNEKHPLFFKATSTFKRDNRRRVERCLKKMLQNLDSNNSIKEHNSLPDQGKLEVNLRKLPDGNTPMSIRRYPVEFPDLQSPFKFYNEPTEAAIRSGYEGYEARVACVDAKAVYCPLRIPTLEPEGELNSLEIPVSVTTENGKKVPTEQIALIYLYLEEKRSDPYYKGIFFPGDLEKLDVWCQPCNKDETLLDKRLSEAYRRWQQL